MASVQTSWRLDTHVSFLPWRVFQHQKDTSTKICGRIITPAISILHFMSQSRHLSSLHPNRNSKHLLLVTATFCAIGRMVSQSTTLASIWSDSNLSPHQMLTGCPPPWWMQDFRVFGCLVFVLDKRLQDGKSLPKWKARSWTGVYVGYSLQNAGNVAIVYNPLTTHLSRSSTPFLMTHSPRSVDQLHLWLRIIMWSFTMKPLGFTRMC